MSSSAAQAAHEIIGYVEILIRDFVLPATISRNVDRIHRHLVQCLSHCLTHDGLQSIGVKVYCA